MLDEDSSAQRGWRQRLFRDGESAKNVLVAVTLVAVVLLFVVTLIVNQRLK